MTGGVPEQRLFTKSAAKGRMTDESTEMNNAFK
jgi:hypothetical protein